MYTHRGSILSDLFVVGCPLGLGLARELRGSVPLEDQRETVTQSASDVIAHKNFKTLFFFFVRPHAKKTIGSVSDQQGRTWLTSLQHARSECQGGT